MILTRIALNIAPEIRSWSLLGPEILKYFWRLKSWIVGPLSQNRIMGSGFFIGGRDAIFKSMKMFKRSRAKKSLRK